MLLLRGYEQWRGISFLGDHFSAVAIGRKLYVIILFYVGSAFVVLCRRSLECGRNLCFRYFIECLLVCHEGTDALAGVADLDADKPQEGAAFPSSHDHDCLWIHVDKKYFHVKPCPKDVGAYLFV